MIFDLDYTEPIKDKCICRSFVRIEIMIYIRFDPQPNKLKFYQFDLNSMTTKMRQSTKANKELS